jgi:epoxyqueuosine reductase
MGNVAISRTQLEQLAVESGIDLVGVTLAQPVEDAGIYADWVTRGRAAGMAYLTDHRATLRRDPRNLLASAQTVLVAGVLYNTNEANTDPAPEHGWISRYAWGPLDYHEVVRERLEALARRLQEKLGSFQHRVCVDTAPLLERSLARQAGLGWIGKNTCLINQAQGSWFFLGEILMAAGPEEFEVTGSPAPDRCGTCQRCIEACPTEALVPGPQGWELDSARCISYLTIEARHVAPEELRPAVGNHVFGCDICQDVCPWNGRAPFTTAEAFTRSGGNDLAELAELSADEFRQRFRRSPVWRTKHRGLLRNVAIALGNAGAPRYAAIARQLAEHDDPDVAEAARWAVRRLTEHRA